MFHPDAIEQFLRLRVTVGSRILVAVSGGPDSVALLHALRGSSYLLTVGHVDHGLRESARKDARFVEALARKWDLPCLISRSSVPAYARKHRLGIEEAAREVRYQALAAMARKGRASAIVTAHTLDDQAETVLMHFLRGAAGAGLAGIPDERPVLAGHAVTLLRPLLSVSKAEVFSYIRKHRLAYRVDPTNRSTRFTRNRIRRRLLPLLERESPGLKTRLGQSAQIFREDERYWAQNVKSLASKIMRQTGSGWTVVLTGLLGYHKALIRRIFRLVLPGASFQDIEQVLLLADSKKRMGSVTLTGGWHINRRGSALQALRKRNR